MAHLSYNQFLKECFGLVCIKCCEFDMHILNIYHTRMHVPDGCTVIHMLCVHTDNGCIQLMYLAERHP